METGAVWDVLFEFKQFLDHHASVCLKSDQGLTQDYQRDGFSPVLSCHDDSPIASVIDLLPEA